jgi:MFS family permease
MTRDLRIVCLSLLFWGLGEGLFIYFQPIYLDQLGADPIEIGGLLGLASLAFAISHIPAGALADTFGRKNILVLAWFVGALAGLLMYVATSLPIFVVGISLYYFTGFVMAPLQSYVTAAKGSWSVTRALTTTSAFISIGSILGPVIGGQLAELVGLKMIYAIATGIFLFSASLILFLRPQPVESTITGARYQNLLKNKALAGFLVIVFIVLFGMYLSWPLTPVFLQEERGISVGSLGLFGSINAAGIVVMSLILGRLNPRFGFVIVQFATASSILMLWRGVNQIWLLMGYFLAAGFRTARSLVSAQVEILVNRFELGLALGFAETINGSVMLIAAPIGGVLYDIKPELPFPVSIGILAVALITSLRFTARGQFIRSIVDSPMNQSQ